MAEAVKGQLRMKGIQVLMMLMVLFSRSFITRGTIHLEYLDLLTGPSTKEC